MAGDRERLFIVLASLVGGVWAITALASLILHDYTALSIVSPVMLILAGFLFRANGRRS